MPLADSLDLIAALRYDHYSDFGGDVNPKLSLRYRATDDLIVRASWSTGFRAPSLSQLGAGESLGTAYINCGVDQPFDALCGEFGASFGELELDQLRTGFFNVGSQKTDGVDVKVNYRLETDQFGTKSHLTLLRPRMVMPVRYTTGLAACGQCVTPCAFNLRRTARARAIWPFLFYITGIVPLGLYTKRCC